jgi:hypothetical protein
MTLEEIKKAFPIGSRIRVIGHIRDCLIGREFIVSGYSTITFKITVAILLVEKGEWEGQFFYTKDVELVHGPAVQEPNHDGMVYNVITWKWSWF